MSSPRTIAAVAIATLALSAPVLAQCTPGWVPGIGSQAFSTTVRGAAIMPDGDIIVCGSSGSIGSTPIGRVARYNPASNTWSTVGPSITSNNTVEVVKALPNGDILAGGGFSTLGGVTTNRVGRYSAATNTWSDVGYGTNGGSVYDILPMPNGDFYIGGPFQRVAGVLTQCIGRYNAATNTWSPLNSQMNSTGDNVQTLELDTDGTILVGGSFLGAGNVAGTARIARYHPATNTWSALGTGVNSEVRDIEILPDGDILVAGYFSTAGGVPANRIARFNPASGTWSALGTGLNASVSPYVKTLCLLPDGTCMVGGAFTNAGGVPVNNLARVNLATNLWSGFSGTNSDVEQIVRHPSGDLIIVGSFNSPGGRTARWSFGASNPTIDQQPTDTMACFGNPAAFTVAASGASPLTYQWRHNTNIISPATNPSAATSTLTIAAAQPEGAGSYDCFISGPCGSSTSSSAALLVNSADFNNDGDTGTDADIEAFFACLGGACCPTCGSSDFNADGDFGTDADIEAFFRVLAGGPC